MRFHFRAYRLELWFLGSMWDCSLNIIWADQGSMEMPFGSDLMLLGFIAVHKILLHRTYECFHLLHLLGGTHTLSNDDPWRVICPSHCVLVSSPPPLMLLCRLLVCRNAMRSICGQMWPFRSVPRSVCDGARKLTRRAQSTIHMDISHSWQGSAAGWSARNIKWKWMHDIATSESSPKRLVGVSCTNLHIYMWWVTGKRSRVAKVQTGSRTI